MEINKNAQKKYQKLLFKIVNIINFICLCYGTPSQFLYYAKHNYLKFYLIIIFEIFVFFYYFIYLIIKPKLKQKRNKILYVYNCTVFCSIFISLLTKVS